MVSASELERALRVLKFTRIEVVYAAQLRTRSTDAQLARKMNLEIKEFKKQIAKARRGAARKVLYRCRVSGKISDTKFEALCAFTG